MGRSILMSDDPPKELRRSQAKKKAADEAIIKKVVTVPASANDGNIECGLVGIMTFESKLRYVFGVVEEFRLKGAVHTAQQLVDECSEFINERASRYHPASPEREVLGIMAAGLERTKATHAVKAAYLKLKPHVGSHPDKMSLFEGLGRRILLGELSSGGGHGALADFGKKMAQVYDGQLKPEDVWEFQWRLFEARCHVEPSKGKDSNDASGMGKG